MTTRRAGQDTPPEPPVVTRRDERAASTKEAFDGLTGMFPDPLLLVDGAGRLLRASTSAVGLCPALLDAATLEACCTDGAGVAAQAPLWTRARTPVLSALTLRGAAGEPVRCQVRAMAAPRAAGAGDEAPDAPGVALLQLTALDGPGEHRRADDVVAALADEVAQLRRAEAARAKAAEAERASLLRHQQLSVLTAALASAVSLRQVADVIRTEVPLAVGARAVVLGLDLETLLPVLEDGPGARAAGPWIDLADDPHGLLREAFARNAAVRCDGSPRPLAGYDHVAADGDHGGLCLPLRGADREILGVLALATEDPAPDPDEAFLHVVGLQVAQALHRTGLYERERLTAQRLQLSLLPQLPELAEVQTAARYAPGSNITAVGGDWYDMFALPGGRIGLAVGDVSGHGLSEATEMAQLRNALRAIALEVGDRPGEVMRRLDEFANTYLPDRTATACYLVYDRATGVLRYSNAGHMPPLLVEADGTTRLLEGTTPLLGLPLPRDDAHEEAALGPGTTLVLYTDGLVERRGEHLDDGFARLRGLAAGGQHRDPDALCRLLLDGMGEEEAPDDRALMVVRFGGGGGPPEPEGREVRAAGGDGEAPRARGVHPVPPPAAAGRHQAAGRGGHAPRTGGARTRSQGHEQAPVPRPRRRAGTR